MERDSRGAAVGSALRVVVTGQLDPDTEQACADMGIHRVRGVLSSVQLAQLVARSRVLVFGSAYEGFGLPPVEAYSLGTPATYQRVGAMAEVLDDFPGGYEEPRYDRFADALAEVLTLDKAALLTLQARMQQRFQWSEVARATLDAYRSAAGEPKQAPAILEIHGWRFRPRDGLNHRAKEFAGRLPHLTGVRRPVITAGRSVMRAPLFRDAPWVAWDKARTPASPG